MARWKMLIRTAAAIGLSFGASFSLAEGNQDPTSVARPDDAPSSAALISKGYQRYHGVCSHCHGPDGVGSTFAPSLVDRAIAHDDFRDVVLHGRARGAFVMQGYAKDPNVAPYIDAIYAYLKARREGLGRGRPPEP